jgi:hypothetical protein
MIEKGAFVSYIFPILFAEYILSSLVIICLHITVALLCMQRR